jgi:hypothetical protein
MYGSIAKLIDDSFDMKIIKNEYIIELLKVIYVITIILLFQLKNYYVYLIIFLSWIPFIFLPDAFTTNPFFAIITTISIIVSAYYLLMNLNVYNIFIFTIIFYTEWFSGFLTEIGERVPYTNYIKTNYPNVYSFFFLEEDVEISKKKMYMRLLNATVAIIFLLFLNNWIIQYINMDNQDFKIALTITSMYIFGYNIISSINQYYMIYVKGVEYQKIHKQIDGFFGIKDKTAHEVTETVELEVHPK